MDRRETLKLMMIAAMSSERLSTRLLSAQETGFISRWHQWPNMGWAGPEHWGNRLQDWQVMQGSLVCQVCAPDRTLHCLTHYAKEGHFMTSVEVVRTVKGSDAVTGFRIGLKGPVDDIRSAVVHGNGLDVGIDGSGALVIGSARSKYPISSYGSLRIDATITRSNSGSRIELVARSASTGTELASLSHEDHTESDVIGSIALLSHVGEQRQGPGAIFRDWTISGLGIETDPAAAFGPIMFAQYTAHRGVLKLTAQLAPIESIHGVRCELDICTPDDIWETVAASHVDRLSRTARFRVEEWDVTRAAKYRVRLTLPLRNGPETFEYLGTIAEEPGLLTPVRAAVFSCNADHGFPDADVVSHVLKHSPDLALFLGDQFYEGSGGFGIQTDTIETALLDMLHKWYMFGWSYREIFRNIPTAFIPDDHDVYHGNIWGESGRKAPTESGWGAPAQDQGGFKMPPEWVNAVQVAQTSHLPDPYDPTPVDQGIGVYYTRWDYGGVSFAILEDRKFKSSPSNVMPTEARVLNGWIQNPQFDVTQHRDPPGSELLGARQMNFLEAWSEDWSGSAQMKVVLSQTNFASVHSIPSDAMSGAVLPSLPMPQPGTYVEGDKIAADMDSNGWPSQKRDDVLRILRRCSAFHIAGDQHLATVVRHGIEDFGDAGFTFTGPALNNIWPRRWWPPREDRHAPLDIPGPEYTGDFLDGFGNRITVHASANPRATGRQPALLHDRVTGYGIVIFDKADELITIECWPRHVDPSQDRAMQFEGWPITVHSDSGDGRKPVWYLPSIRVHGLEHAPVVQLRSISGKLIYSRRMQGMEFNLPVFDYGPHVVRIGDPDIARWLEHTVQPNEQSATPLFFDFTQ